MDNRSINPGDIFRHFKNKLYQIVAIAYHSETKEKMVVYQALYGDFKFYVRPYDMFMSEVDHVKYPEVTDKYRFTKVENISEEKIDTQNEKTDDFKKYEDSGVNPYLMMFFDKETMEEKIEFLGSIRDKLDDRLISDIAVSMDLTIEEGSLEEKYDSLLYCLKTRAKFECNRFR